MYIIYIILHTFNPHNVKKTPQEEGKKTCVLKKFLKKTPRSLTLMSGIGQLKKKQ